MLYISKQSQKSGQQVKSVVTASFKQPVDQGLLILGAVSRTGDIKVTRTECTPETECTARVEVAGEVIGIKAGFRGRSGSTRHIYHVAVIGKPVIRIPYEDEEHGREGGDMREHTDRPIMIYEIPDFSYGFGVVQKDVTSITINSNAPIVTSYRWIHEKGVEEGVVARYPYTEELDYRSTRNHLFIRATQGISVPQPPRQPGAVSPGVTSVAGQQMQQVPLPQFMIIGSATVIDVPVAPPKPHPTPPPPICVIVRRKGEGKPVEFEAECDGERRIGIDQVVFERRCRVVRVIKHREAVSATAATAPVFVVETVNEDGGSTVVCELVGGGECRLEQAEDGTQQGQTKGLPIPVMLLVIAAVAALVTVVLVKRGKKQSK